jgi:hypothetical protein
VKFRASSAGIAGSAAVQRGSQGAATAGSRAQACAHSAGFSGRALAVYRGSTPQPWRHAERRPAGGPARGAAPQCRCAAATRIARATHRSFWGPGALPWCFRSCAGPGSPCCAATVQSIGPCGHRPRCAAPRAAIVRVYGTACRGPLHAAPPCVRPAPSAMRAPLWAAGTRRRVPRGGAGGSEPFTPAAGCAFFPRAKYAPVCHELWRQRHCDPTARAHGVARGGRAGRARCVRASPSPCACSPRPCARMQPSPRAAKRCRHACKLCVESSCGSSHGRRHDPRMRPALHGMLPSQHYLRLPQLPQPRDGLSAYQHRPCLGPGRSFAFPSGRLLLPSLFACSCPCSGFRGSRVGCWAVCLHGVLRRFVLCKHAPTPHHSHECRCASWTRLCCRTRLRLFPTHGLSPPVSWASSWLPVCQRAAVHRALPSATPFSRCNDLHTHGHTPSTPLCPSDDSAHTSLPIRRLRSLRSHHARRIVRPRPCDGCGRTIRATGVSRTATGVSQTPASPSHALACLQGNCAAASSSPGTPGSTDAQGERAIEWQSICLSVHAYNNA